MARKLPQGFFIIFLMLLPFLFGCIPSSPYKGIKNFYSATGTNLICFGDSLTAGQGASPGMDYPSILRKNLPLPVINAGVSGDTTQSGLNRLEADVLNRNPKIVIVELGANDFLPSSGRGPAVAEAFNRLETIIDRIQEKGAVVVVAGVSINYDIGERYQKLAKRKRAVYVPDIMEGIVSNPSLMADFLHPNDRGYEKMAEKFLAVLQPLLKEMQ